MSYQIGNNNTSFTVYSSTKPQLEEIPWGSIPPKAYQKGLNININHYFGTTSEQIGGSAPGTTSEDERSSSAEFSSPDSSTQKRGSSPGTTTDDERSSSTEFPSSDCSESYQIGNNNTSFKVYASTNAELEGIPWDSIPPEAYQKGLNININHYYGTSGQVGGSAPETTSEDERSSSTGSSSPDCNVRYCRDSIGVLTDHTRNDTETILLKEHILFQMHPDNFPSRLPTAKGHAHCSLPHKEQWQINQLMTSTCPPHETLTHNILRELKAEGLRLSHVVQFFSQESTKRLDIIELIAKIHPSCDFCSGHFTEM